jgi:ankyrin repeat protein
LKCFIEHERFINNGSRRILYDASKLLFDAARWNSNPEVIRILIENGANPNAENQKKTPLHFAVAFNPNIAVAQCLVKLGANINTEPEIMFDEKARLTNTHLHYAARYNPNAEVSKWLVENGANPFQPPNHEKLTPCEYAVMYNTNFDVVRFFVDIYLEEYTDYDTAMRLLCMAITNSPQKEVVDLLAKRVKNINTCWRGRPPLHHAITHYAAEPNSQSKPIVNRQERFGFVDVLIKNGADMNAVTSGGYTIYAVAESDDYDGSLTEFLREYDARKR